MGLAGLGVWCAVETTETGLLAGVLSPGVPTLAIVGLGSFSSARVGTGVGRSGVTTTTAVGASVGMVIGIAVAIVVAGSTADGLAQATNPPISAISAIAPKIEPRN